MQYCLRKSEEVSEKQMISLVLFFSLALLAFSTLLARLTFRIFITREQLVLSILFRHSCCREMVANVCRPPCTNTGILIGNQGCFMPFSSLLLFLFLIALLLSSLIIFFVSAGVHSVRLGLCSQLLLCDFN